MPKPQPNKIRQLEADEALDAEMRAKMEVAIEQERVDKAQAKRRLAARVEASKDQVARTAHVTSVSSTPGGGDSSRSAPWDKAAGAPKPAPPSPGHSLAPPGTPLAEVGGCSLPPPIPAGHPGHLIPAASRSLS